MEILILGILIGIVIAIVSARRSSARSKQVPKTITKHQQPKKDMTEQEIDELITVVIPTINNDK